MDAKQATKIREALEGHQSDFRGIQWQPRRMVQTNTIALIMGVAQGLTEEVEELPLGGLPTSATLRRYQHDIVVAYERVRRNRLYDQGEFFRQVGIVFDLSGKVFEELARLERMGLFDPES